MFSRTIRNEIDRIQYERKVQELLKDHALYITVQIAEKEPDGEKEGKDQDKRHMFSR